MKRLKRQKMKLLAVMLLFAVSISGCGSRRTEPVNTAIDAGSQGKEAEEETTAPAEEASELKYIELIEVEDYYGDKSMHEVYAPRGNSNEDGFVFYSDHGLTFAASVYNVGENEYLVESLKYSVELETESWLDDGSEYMEVEISEVLKNGKDRYQIITAKKEDLFGTPYEVKYIYYMDIQEKGCGVLWNLQLSEIIMDSETDSIIDELAGCYDVDLNVIKASGGWAAANEERLNQEKAANSLPETVLWFNATYAPLTYSNGCNWKIVGGMEPSEYNMKFIRQILSRDWGIEDADSAMETIENLRENGHRAKCLECMEKLEELGILDEKDEEKFALALLNSGIEENIYRYVIAYQMYRSGLDADYIAAWDLCRVNQLYAEFYICGYMSYEEAMDASLENSIILQQMYSSWDEMAGAYLLGYEFWQNDLMLTDDSPTMKRYQCYVELLEMEEGPYTLDWNMELEKSWQ